MVPDQALAVGQDPVVLGQVGVAHIALGGGLGRDDVALVASLDDRPVDRRSLRRIAQVLQLDELVRQFGDGVTALFRSGTGMGRPALHVQEHGVDAVGRDR